MDDTKRKTRRKYNMAANKETMTSNLTGIYDFDEETLTKVDEKNGGETIYSLKDMLRKFNGLNVSFTAKVDTEIKPLVEDEA
jgi:hypothetical protein